ncbi:MAG: FAD-binding protein [Lactobacillus sp.]|jgi:succinate dehydrogenase/fumarate reductase flavoprotein subunit|nr:FAD-binding protein [Lactobacillus sp.]
MKTIAWSKTYDVIVLGFGGAGATAARFAADNGAKVLLCEVAPEGHEGGNTRYCAQAIDCADNKEQITQYYQKLTSPLEIDTEVADTYCDGLVNMKSYLQKYLGVEPVDAKDLGMEEAAVEYPEFAGAQSNSCYFVHKGVMDSALWKKLKAEVEKRDNIDIWYETRALHLIKENETVVGVQIQNNDHLFNIAAKNGVVLATGGFENNKQMIRDYLGRSALSPLGTLYNKGDGLKMAQEIGADMWHLSSWESTGMTFNVPEGNRAPLLPQLITFVNGSALVISDDGSRYFNEAYINRHGRVYSHGTWRIPEDVQQPYLIFDQAQYDDLAKAKVLPILQKALIKADDLAELAEKIGLEKGTLDATVSRFNQQVEQGFDYEEHRNIATMRKFAAGPYYAVPMRQSILNTQGGPRRNAQAQVIDTNGKPIKHLYSAGEVGGIATNLYQGGSNMAECLIFGKIAGENAAKVKDDAVDVQTSASKMAGELPKSKKTKPLKVTLGPDQYLGKSDLGMGDEMVVRVTYKDHQLKNVEILQESESADYGHKAVEILPKRMVAENKIDVDSVTGASLSS